MSDKEQVPPETEQQAEEITVGSDGDDVEAAVEPQADAVSRV